MKHSKFLDLRFIEPNSIEALILFILYICMQDKNISKEEIKELLVTAPILNRMYFDIFGEYIAIDLENMINDLNTDLNNLEIEKQCLTNNQISNFEKNLFKNLLTDLTTQDIALLASRNAASADGLHQSERYKYDYWMDKWNIV